MSTRSTVVAFVLGVLCTAPVAVFAGALAPPIVFANGTPAEAGEVNSNFAAVRTEINDNDSRIRDNGTAIASNTTNVANNTTSIADNAGDIGDNTTAIDANTAAIADLSGVTVLNGRFFKLYGAEITGNANSASSVPPHINMTATRGNHIGSAVFEIVGTPHCSYCYSGGPKAIIYQNGNIPYAFYTLGDSVYLDLGTSNNLTIRSSHPIQPEVLTALPGGVLAVMAIN